MSDNSLNQDLNAANKASSELVARSAEVVKSMSRGALQADQMQKALHAADGDLNKLGTHLFEATKQMVAMNRHSGSLSRIMSDLEEGTDGWVKSLGESQEGIASISRSFLGMAKQAATYQKSLEDHEDAIRNTKSLLLSYGKAIGSAGKGFRDIQEEESRILKDLGQHGRALSEITALQKDQAAFTQRAADIARECEELEKKRLTTVGKGRDELDGRIAALRGEQDVLKQTIAQGERDIALKEKGADISAETAANALRELEYLEEKKKIQDKLSSNLEGYHDSRGGKLTAVGKTMGGLFKGHGGLSDMLNMDAKQLRGLRAQFGKVGAGAKDAFGDGLMGKAAGGIAKLGAGAAGGAAAIAGLFPIAALATAIGQALWSFVSEMDGFYKKYANATNQLAAPMLDGKKFAPLVKAFGNITVGAASLNQELGMTGDEMVSMYKGLIAGGSSLQRVLGQSNPFQPLEEFQAEMADNHAKVARGMRHGSALLGMSIEDSSKATGEMLNQLRSPLDSIESQYDNIANSAKRAGLQGAYFMRVIEQSVLSLANYGNFTNVASRSLEHFSKSGMTSQKTAEEAANAVTNLFQDPDKNFQLLGLFAGSKGGGQNSLDDLWKQSMGSKQADLAKWGQERIKKDPEGYNKLLAEIGQMKDVASIGDSGNRFAAMSENAQFLTENAGKVLHQLIMSKKALGPGATGDRVIDNETILRKSGMIPEALIKQLAANQSGMRAHMGDINKVLPSDQNLQAFMLDKGGTSEKLLKSKTAEDIDKMYKRIEALDVGQEQKAALKKMLETPDTFLKMMKGSYKEVNGKKQWGVDSDGLSEDYAFAFEDQGNKARNEKVKNQKDTVDQITELSKRLQINKDKVSWLVSSSSPMQSIIGLMVKIQETIASILDVITIGLASKDAAERAKEEARAKAERGESASGAEEAGSVLSSANSGGFGGNGFFSSLANSSGIGMSLGLYRGIASVFENRSIAEGAAPPKKFASGGYAIAGTSKKGDQLLARINSGEWVVPGETMSNIAAGVQNQVSLVGMLTDMITGTSGTMRMMQGSAAGSSVATTDARTVHINVQGVSADEVLRVFKREFSKREWNGKVNGVTTA